jgi:hypothetical protein
LSLDFDGFKIGVGAIVEIHNDLIKEVENIERKGNSYTVEKMRLCLASNINFIREVLGKLDKMVEIDNGQQQPQHEIALRSDIGLQLEALKAGSNIQPVLDYIMDRIAQLRAMRRTLCAMPAESVIVGGGTRKVSAVMDGIRKMVCDKCGRGWGALCYESSERLECPGCGYMVQVPPLEAVESAGTDTQPTKASIKPSCDLCTRSVTSSMCWTCEGYNHFQTA